MRTRRPIWPASAASSRACPGWHLVTKRARRHQHHLGRRRGDAGPGAACCASPPTSTTETAASYVHQHLPVVELVQADHEAGRRADRRQRRTSSLPRAYRTAIAPACPARSTCRPRLTQQTARDPGRRSRPAEAIIQRAGRAGVAAVARRHGSGARPPLLGRLVVVVGPGVNYLGDACRPARPGRGARGARRA